MASNDPTDTGGLFVGRRPGTGPVHFKQAPPGTSRRQLRRDAGLAHALLAVELILCLSLFGPQPLGWLWIGSQVEYLSASATMGIVTVVLGCLASLMLTMAVAKRVDHAWKLVRRAAGHAQQRGALELIFVACVAVMLVAFAVWFFVLTGPGPSLAPS